MFSYAEDSQPAAGQSSAAPSPAPSASATTPSPYTQQRVEVLGELAGFTEAVAVQGGYAYLGIGYRLVILDITDRSRPTIVGETAYLLTYEHGLYILDVSNSSSPQQKGFLSPLSVTRDLAADGNVALVSSKNGLYVFDASIPASPVLVGSFLVPQNFSSYPPPLSVSGSHAYMASGRALAILDVSDTTRIAPVSTITTTGDLNALAVAGGYAYLAERGVGLSVVDVSNPAKPTNITAVSMDGEGNDITLSGSRGYATTSAEWIDGQLVGGGLRVLDVSNPVSPTVIGRYDSIKGGHVAVSGSLAYVGPGDTLFRPQRRGHWFPVRRRLQHPGVGGLARGRRADVRHRSNQCGSRDRER